MTQLHSETPVDIDADDLTADDHLAVETEKAAPGDPDADLPDPDQDPGHIPPSALDENSRQR
jgi:hypothetical protein